MTNWYVVNHENDDSVVRGPYDTSKEAAAVRRELELQEEYDHMNLWIVARP